MGTTIEQAIIWASIIWVALSWVKIWITPKMPIYRFLCQKCITFWVTLAITWNLPVAAVAALIAVLIDKHLNNINLTL
jgi:hypothetical protein